MIFIDLYGQKKQGKIVDYQKCNNCYVVELNGLVTGKIQIKIKPNQICNLDYLDCIKFIYINYLKELKKQLKNI